MLDVDTKPKIDRTVFFPRVRGTVFHGFLNQSQVDGINDLLDAFALEYPAGDPRWLAYMLATVFHETDETMLPIEEIGRGHGRPYGVVQPNGQRYYGRGYVQLTWPNNYKALSPVVGIDLYANPDEALKPSIASKIMFYGMEHGTFTGHKLADYITPTKTDFLNARRIINGIDRAALIAGYAQNFLSALGAKS